MNDLRAACEKWLRKSGLLYKDEFLWTDSLEAFVRAAVEAAEERHGESIIDIEGHGVSPESVSDDYSYSARCVREKVRRAVEAERAECLADCAAEATIEGIHERIAARIRSRVTREEPAK